MAAEPQLTPACELAFAVAREGVEAETPIEAPVVLRNFLAGDRPSRRVLFIVQRALDTDAGFRRRVAERATEDSVGRAGWLFLHRPDGWDGELDRLIGRGAFDERDLAVHDTDGVVGSLHADHDEDLALLTGGEGEVASDGPAEPAYAAGPAPDPRHADADAEPAVGTDLDAGGADGEPGVDRDTSSAPAGDATAPEAGGGPQPSAIEAELQGLRSLVERLVSDGGYRTGSTVRELAAQLASANDERDEVAGALAATTADRDQARETVAALEGRLTSLEADLERVTAERVSFQHELERVRAEHLAASRAQQQVIEDLADRLTTAEDDRRSLAVELEAARSRVDDARLAFERAVVEAAAELQAALAPHLDAAGEAAQAVGAGIEVAADRARRLHDHVSGADADALDLDPVASTAGEPVHIEDVAADLSAGDADAGGVPSALVGGATEPDADDYAQQLSDFSREITDALAPYLTDPSLREQAPTGGLVEAALAGWLGGDGTDVAGADDAAGWAAVAAAAVGGADEVATGEVAAGEVAAGDHATDGWADVAAAVAGATDAGWDADAEGPRQAWTNPGDGPITDRQPLPVPDDLREEPLALARYVVSVPDVVLLIDGDGVGGLGWPTLPVAEQRDALVSYLADLAGATGAAADVVFDGDVGDEATLPLADLVRVRLTAPGVAATHAVAQLVDAYPVDWPVVVVTEDTELARGAARRGAAVLPNVGLLDLFIAQ